MEPFSISKADLKRFTEAFYQWFLKTKLRLIAAVVDKEQMEEQYTTPHHASAVGYVVLLQRFQKFLGSRQGMGYVTCDEIGGASAAGNAWKQLLQRQHRKLKRNGCPYTGLEFPRIEDRLEFVDSTMCGLVQIADIAAYNIFRQFRDHGSTWDDPDASTLPLYSYFSRMLPRVHQGPGNVFAGYGVAKMPTKARHQWVA